MQEIISNQNIKESIKINSARLALLLYSSSVDSERNGRNRCGDNWSMRITLR